MVYTHVIAALVGAVLAAVSAWQVQSWRWHATVDRIERYHAEQLQRGETAARAREQAIQLNAERIADEAEKKRAELADRVAATQSAAGRLRDDLARLNARPVPADPGAAAFAHEARTARELLGACTAEYRGLAQSADELRDQVTGLQNFVTSVRQ